MADDLIARLRNLVIELSAPVPDLGGKPGAPGWTATQHAYLAGRAARIGQELLKLLPEVGAQSREIAALREALERAERNRDMWKGQSERQATELERLRERGAKAVIAYHVAICSPKGVVPVDDLYDPALAADIQRKADITRQALKDAR